MTTRVDGTFDAEALLRVWERGAGSTEPSDAALTLCATEHVGSSHTLGGRNAALLRIHSRLFGRQLDLLSRCPLCDAAVQFACDCDAWLQQLPTTIPETRHQLRVHDHVVEFRLPVHVDVVQAAAAGPDDFAWRLLDLCVLSCWRGTVQVSPRELPPSVLNALSERLDALDPGASLSFALECPGCATKWSAAIDLAQLLWDKVQWAAEQVLLDVDALARVYGWTEREALQLSPLRRAAYVQLATS